MRISLTLLFFLIVTSGAHALRCTDAKGVGRIVQQGDNMAEVMIKCSEPDYKYSKGLLLDEEVWVYQHDDGMVYSVNFLQGNVESIDAERL